MKIPFHNLILYCQSNSLGWNSQYLLIYKMSISDNKQTIFVLKALTDMVYNEIQAAYIFLEIMS